MSKVNDIPKNYAYRIDRDTGFAPNIEDGICTLSGCKPGKLICYGS